MGKKKKLSSRLNTGGYDFSRSVSVPAAARSVAKIVNKDEPDSMNTKNSRTPEGLVNSAFDFVLTQTNNLFLN